MSEEYIKPGRVLIFIQIVFIPIYFFLLANIFESVTIPFLSDTITEFIVRILSPLTLSIPIVLFSYYQRYEVSEAYEHMGETIWNLPNSIKAFYGFNFLLVILCGLPFIAPIIALSGGYFIGITIFGKKDEVVQISRPLIKFSTLIFIPYAIFISLIFYSQFEVFFNAISGIWTAHINLLYLTSLNIANGALISGLLLILFDYVEKNSLTFEKPSFLNTLLGLFVFIILESLLLYFAFGTAEGISGTQQLLFSIVNIIGFLLSLVLIIFRWLLRSEYTETGTGIIGWITIFAFQLVNILSSEEIAIFSKTSAIVITSIIFIILFINSYSKAIKYI